MNHHLSQTCQPRDQMSRIFLHFTHAHATYLVVIHGDEMLAFSELQFRQLPPNNQRSTVCNSNTSGANAADAGQRRSTNAKQAQKNSTERPAALTPGRKPLRIRLQLELNAKPRSAESADRHGPAT